MKEITGLVIAAVLGILAVALNWFYLDSKTKNFEMQTFLGVKDGVTITVGDTFKPEHFTPVQIPAAHVKGLEDFVFLYEDAKTVENTKAVRPYLGGELLFKSDYRTPMPKLKTPAIDEVLLPITVAERHPSIAPGDLVEFIFSKPGSPGEANTASEIIGPFTVATIGNQVGSMEVMKAYHIQHVSPNQLNLLVKKEGDGLEASAQTLINRLSQADARTVRVLWHGPAK